MPYLYFFVLLKMGAGRVVANATSTTDVIIFYENTFCLGATRSCLLVSFRFSSTPLPLGSFVTDLTNSNENIGLKKSVFPRAKMKHEGVVFLTTSEFNFNYGGGVEILID